MSCCKSHQLTKNRNLNEDDFLYHFTMGLFKGKEKKPQQFVKCKYCDMKFEDNDRLKRHSRKAHKEKGGDLSNPNPFGGF